MAGAIDAKSPYTHGHCDRVPEIARELGFPYVVASSEIAREMGMLAREGYEDALSASAGGLAPLPPAVPVERVSPPPESISRTAPRGRSCRRTSPNRRRTSAR